jgi:hypothetical protein
MEECDEKRLARHWPFWSAHAARQKRPIPSKLIRVLAEAVPRMPRTTVATPMASATPLSTRDRVGWLLMLTSRLGAVAASSEVEAALVRNPFLADEMR